MSTHSGRTAVWLIPLVVAVMSCSGGTQEARSGAPVFSTAEALPATPSSASAPAASRGTTPGVPTADPESQDPAPDRSTEAPPTDDPLTRPGAPYEIEPFDNLDGPYDAFLDTIPSRCPEGEGPNCLLIVTSITGDDTAPEQCTVTSIDNDPEAGPAEVAEKRRKLQRGTRVHVVVTCPETAVDPEDTPPPTTEPEPTTDPPTEPEPTTDPPTEPEPTTDPPTTEPEPGADPPSEPQPELPERTAP